MVVVRANGDVSTVAALDESMDYPTAVAFGGAGTVAVPTANHDAAFAAADETLRAARVAAAARPLDPIAAHKLATESHRKADELLAAVRADAEQHARLLAAVDASFTTARADVDRAADFIATRRNGVGRQARTRLAEADRLLQGAMALRDADPKAALDQARRAERLAEEAYSLAGNDFDQWDRGGPGAGAGRGGGSDLAGAILGGMAGSAIEKDVTKANGVEVTVRLDSGRIVAIIQEGSGGEFRPGDRVRVTSDGYTTRVTR